MKPLNKVNKEKKILVNKTKYSRVKDTKDKLVINGKVYHSVNKAVTYFLSKHDKTHAQSLADREVNSRGTGEGTRVICKAPNRKIYICSIDNHEIIDVPLIIAGGVIQTTLGEGILILS